MTRTLAVENVAIERVVGRIAGLREPRLVSQGSGMIDVKTLAAVLGTSGSYVYEHADQLGVIRLGDGPRARLRFDLDTVLERLTACSTSRESKPSPRPPLKRKPGSTRATPSGAEVDLLPITPRRGLK